MQQLDLEQIAPLVPEALGRFFHEHPRVALAYSGGCDSVFLLACGLASGAEVCPFTVNTAFQYAFEADDARLAADQLGSETNLLTLDIFAHPEVTANPPDRCYHCKKVIFTTIKEAAAREGIEVLIDGTNASDDPARRPGVSRDRRVRRALAPARSEPHEGCDPRPFTQDGAGHCRQAELFLPRNTR